MDTTKFKPGVTVRCIWNSNSRWYGKICIITKPSIREGDHLGWYVKRLGEEALEDWFETKDFESLFEPYDEDYAFFSAVGPGECKCKIPKQDCKFHR